MRICNYIQATLSAGNLFGNRWHASTPTYPLYLTDNQDICARCINRQIHSNQSHQFHADLMFLEVFAVCVWERVAAAFVR